MVDFLVCYGHAVSLVEENTILRKIRKLIIEPIQAPILPAPGRGFTYGKCQLQNQKASFCFMLQIPQILFWVCFLLKYMDKTLFRSVSLIPDFIISVILDLGTPLSTALHFSRNSMTS